MGMYRENVLEVTPYQTYVRMDGTYALLQNFIDVPSNPFRHQTHVIYEDFSYRNRARTGLDLTPVKLIGIIELFRERFEPLTLFTKQSAAAGKGFFTDDKLKDLGVYVTGMQHARDATRHLLQWANFGAGSAFMNMEKVVVKLVEYGAVSPQERIDSDTASD